MSVGSFVGVYFRRFGNPSPNMVKTTINRLISPDHLHTFSLTKMNPSDTHDSIAFHIYWILIMVIGRILPLLIHQSYITL